MQDKRPAVSRRGFLGALGGASTAVAAGAVATLGPSAAEAYDPGEEEMRGRYQETDHVKAYYRVNGYETLSK